MILLRKKLLTTNFICFVFLCFWLKGFDVEVWLVLFAESWSIYFASGKLFVCLEQEVGCFTQRFWLCKPMSFLTTLARLRTARML
jgi:hypothetical protein